MTYEEFKRLSHDDLVDLYINDPEGYVKETREALFDMINQIEDEDKRLAMQRLQWKIDGELRNYKDPVARMNKMVELFWNGVEEFRGTLNK